MDKLTQFNTIELLSKTNELVDEANKLKPVATSGSYNDLTDIPELDSEAIENALGYKPASSNGGDIYGDINIVGGSYLIDGEELESGINLLKRNKEYNIGDIAFSKLLQSSLHLLCIAAGTTSDVEPELETKLINQTFTDGTVTWLVLSYVNHTENYLFVGKESEIDSDKLHNNMIIVDPDDLINPLNADFYNMIGATETINGRAGYVPLPEAGSLDRFLCVDGNWKTIETEEVDLSDIENSIAALEDKTTAIISSTAEVLTIGNVNININGAINSSSNYSLGTNQNYITNLRVGGGDYNSSSPVLTQSNIGNEANKLVQFTSDGHIQLPTGIEIY